MAILLFLIALALFAVFVTLFIIFIIRKDRGHREPTGALFGALGFGVLAIIGAMIVELFVPQIQVLGDAKTHHVIAPLSQIIVGSLCVGLIEESFKSLPLALFIYKRRYFDELTDGIIYFGITAMTFGIIEDVFYTIDGGGGVGILRIIMSPYVHAGFAVLFGLALAYHKVLRKSWWLVALGFIGSVLVHALYDTMAFSGTLLGMLGVLILATILNVLVFYLFRKAQRGDEARGESTIGDNRFCRHCGKPNPGQLLYCSYCGKLS